jgi:transposase
LRAQRGPVCRLGIDEIALKKGHQQFALILSDLDQGYVIDVLEDRHMQRLEAWVDRLKSRPSWPICTKPHRNLSNSIS